MKSVIKMLALAIGLLGLASPSYGQFKMIPNGQVGIGTNPIVPGAKLHVAVGTGCFLVTSNAGWPGHGSLIRGNNTLSTPNKPDYTFYNNDATGMFHPALNVIGFSTSGTERTRITDHGIVIWGTVPQTGYELSVYGDGWFSGIVTTSDARFKKNISTIPTALDKVLKLRGVNYEFRTEEFRQFNFNKGIHCGLIAQELKEVLPEAVKEMNDGYLGVDYNALIPVLVEAIKEQQKQIEELRQNPVASRSSANLATGVSDTYNSSLIDKTTLYQNAPNPFNNETTIKYYVSSGTKAVNIFVYDVNGNKKKSFVITENGEGRVKIAANELGQGIYFYSMVVDGKVIDSKTMLITE